MSDLENNKIKVCEVDFNLTDLIFYVSISAEKIDEGCGFETEAVRVYYEWKTKPVLTIYQDFKIWMKNEGLPPTLYKDTARGQAKVIRQILNSSYRDYYLLTVNIPFLTFSCAFGN